jgi:hypothetical protein
VTYAALGLCLGVLIGIITGYVLILLLRVAMTGKPGLKSNVSIVGELLAIPTFWFGGPWITNLLKLTPISDIILGSYIVALAVVFSGIATYPLLRMIIVLGSQIDQSRHS